LTVCNSCDLPSRYYVGDIGTIVVVDTCNDITAATVTNLIVQKPDQTIVTWAGAVFEDTKIRYIIQSGDFDQVGEYRLQSYVESPGWRGRGDTATFRVSNVFQ
jgi:hypothetical protein